MADLSLIILANNEEIHIDRCIKSSALIAEKIFVVDFFHLTTQLKKPLLLVLMLSSMNSQVMPNNMTGL